MNRTCTKCGKVLPLTSEYFHKSVKGKNGFREHCKECRSTRKDKDKPMAKVSKIVDGKKCCNKCSREFPATKEFFFKDAKGVGGLSSKCKECWGGKNRIKKMNTVLECPEGHKYCTKCKELKTHDEFYKTKQCKDGFESHCKKCTSNRKNTYRREKMLELKTENNLSAKDWRECKEHFDHKCCYCGNSEELQQEHFIAMSNGGAYTKSNILPACGKCNNSKHSNDFFDWYKKQPFYLQEREEKILNYIKDNTEITVRPTVS